MQLKYIIFFIFCIILAIIVYNLHKTSKNSYNFVDYDDYNEFDNIESFDSILKDLNKKKKKKNNNKKSNNDAKLNNDDKPEILGLKKSIKKLKSKKTGTTFDDLFKAAEEIDPDRLSISNMQKNLSDYNDSFKKEKFKNNSKNTAEAFEKFGFYKEKFFEIFN